MLPPSRWDTNVCAQMEVPICEGNLIAPKVLFRVANQLSWSVWHRCQGAGAHGGYAVGRSLAAPQIVPMALLSVCERPCAPITWR